MTPTTRAARAAAKVAEANAELEAAVVAMRNAGASWSQVADAIGVTRQAAWKRFGEAAA